MRVTVARKAFAAREVLANIDFSICAREIVAITGPSGCGKSTLLRIIAGLDTQFEGGFDTTRSGSANVAIAFQEPRLLPWRSVYDNLMLAGAAPETAKLLLSTLGLAGDGDVFADRLSLGMARRVALARALAVAPDLLLLDEPFASLDEASAQRCRAALLQTWQARPCVVLLVTHDLDDAAMLADRILLLAGRPATIERELVIPPHLTRSDAAVGWLRGQLRGAG